MPDAAVGADPEYYPSMNDWTGQAGEVRLVGSRCPRCGKQAFPQRGLCDGCGNDAGIERVVLPGVGALYSFSEVFVAPKAFTTPYVIGYVDFPGDVRVCGQVEHPAAELRVDEPVRVVLGVIRKAEDGRDVVSYKFRRVDGAVDA